jgi:hypothetical protein
MTDILKVWGFKHTEQEMREAFEAVQHKENWKFGNSTWIAADKLEVTSEAISFFTGDTMEATMMGNLAFIKFKGYYATIGA